MDKQKNLYNLLGYIYLRVCSFRQTQLISFKRNSIFFLNCCSSKFVINNRSETRCAKNTQIKNFSSYKSRFPIDDLSSNLRFLFALLDSSRHWPRWALAHKPSRQRFGISRNFNIDCSRFKYQLHFKLNFCYFQFHFFCL